MRDVVIVDDERLARERLARMVTGLGYEVIGEASNGSEALTLIHTRSPSLVLLDIDMPGETGLQVAEKAGLLDTPPAIIFTTAYHQYAMNAFSAFAIAYLLKPVNQTQLAQALENAKTINRAQLATTTASTKMAVAEPPRHLTVSSYRGVDLIAIDSVRCFIADNKYVTVVSTQGETLIDSTLKQLEIEYADLLVRIHRNTLVTLHGIDGLKRTQAGHYVVKLKGVDLQPVISRRYTRKIKDLLQQL